MPLKVKMEDAKSSIIYMPQVPPHTPKNLSFGMLRDAYDVSVHQICGKHSR